MWASLEVQATKWCQLLVADVEKAFLQVGLQPDDRDVTRHYNFTPLQVCLSEMAYTAGCCSLKAQFIPLGIAFGSTRKRLE